MNSYQSKIVGLCLALTETIWLYSILAVLGLMVSIDRSPLTYGACFAIYVTSFYLSKLLNSLNFKLSIAGIIQLSLGVIICYYLVGSSNVPTGEARSFLWPLSLDEWIYEEGKVGTSIVIAACMGVFMWVKGGRIGSTDFPLEALFSTFRVGFIVMAFTVTIDIFHPSDLSMSFLMYLFFAVSLSGLAIGRVKPSSEIGVVSYRWFKIPALTVGIVVLLGIVFSSFSKDVLGAVSSPIATLVSWVAMGIIYLFVLPIVFVIQFIIKMFGWIFPYTNSDGEPVQKQKAFEGLDIVFEGFAKPPATDDPSVFMQYFEYAAILILIGGLVFALSLAFRKINRSQKIIDAGIKSEIVGSDGSMNDLLNIAKKLLWKPHSRNEHSFVIPDDLDGNSKTILSSYYQLLHIGSEKGVNKSLFSTPKEFSFLLYKIFDEGIVRKMTNAFMDVCYGRLAPSSKEADEIKSLVKNLKDKSH